MASFSKSIAKAGSFCAALCTAVVTEHFGASASKSSEEIVQLAAPFLAVLTHVVTDEFVVPVGEEILEQFKNKKPENVNSEIQKTLIEALEKALDGIKLLYKEEKPNESLTLKQKKVVNQFIKNFIEGFTEKSGFHLGNNDLKQIIFDKSDATENTFLYKKQPSNLIQGELELKIEQSKISESVPTKFVDILQSKFLPLTQFYFGEELKSKKNAPARHAFERMLAEDTLNGINQLLHQQEELKSELKTDHSIAEVGRFSKNKLLKLTKIVKELSDPRKLEIQYSKALDERFKELQAQFQYLKEDVNYIKTNVQLIQTALRINSRIAWGIVLLAVISVTIAIEWERFKPFNPVFILKTDSSIHISDQFPPIHYPARLFIILPNGNTQSASIDESNQCVFQEVAQKWAGSKIQIRLKDSYWEPSSHEIILTKGSVIVKIKPNNVLREVEGFVKTSAGIPIRGATIKIESQSCISDLNGCFKDTLPYDILKTQYMLIANAKGFKSDTEYYRPDSSPADIRLQQRKD